MKPVGGAEQCHAPFVHESRVSVIFFREPRGHVLSQYLHAAYAGRASLRRARGLPVVQGNDIDGFGKVNAGDVALWTLFATAHISALLVLVVGKPFCRGLDTIERRLWRLQPDEHDGQNAHLRRRALELRLREGSVFSCPEDFARSFTMLSDVPCRSVRSHARTMLGRGKRMPSRQGMQRLPQSTWLMS